MVSFYVETADASGFYNILRLMLLLGNTAHISTVPFWSTHFDSLCRSFFPLCLCASLSYSVLSCHHLENIPAWLSIPGCMKNSSHSSGMTKTMCYNIHLKYLHGAIYIKYIIFSLKWWCSTWYKHTKITQRFIRWSWLWNTMHGRGTNSVSNVHETFFSVTANILNLWKN